MTYHFSIEIDSTGKLAIEEDRSGKKLWKLSVVMFMIAISLLIMMSLFIIEGLQCRQSVEEADQCGQHLTFFGDPDVVIPTNDDEMDTHCRLMYDSIKCLRKYSRTCLPTFPQQALGMFAYDMKQVIKKRCSSHGFRKQFLEFAKCWSPKEKLHKTNICVDKHIIQLEYIDREVDPEFQIPAFCCTSHERHDCIKREISEICDQKNLDYVIEVIDDSTQAMFEFACDQYVNTNACDQYFNSTVWEPLKDIMNTNDEKLLASRHKHKSSLGPTIAIITHFEM